ncbi:hypothetical protein [Ralstonia solanacearum]|uniref:hypothetical protein n=1 Tax=Ralstonia solanacearum TaxID=305 RepID=UPI0001D94926|nr:hypothetical protein [Ralstonia solanacearum]CBJ43541.1 protein of unknown function [Ralstonia solanacearum CFBP2957]
MARQVAAIVQRESINMAKNQAAATAALAAAAAGQSRESGQAGTDEEAGTTSQQEGGIAEGASGADAPAPTPSPTPRAVTQKRVRARVLVDGRFGKVNDVIEVDGDTLDGAQGELCAHPASVVYALSLKK